MRTMYYSPRHMQRWAGHQRRHLEGVYIPLNVSIDDEAYVVSALVPGIKAEDIEIEVLENSITIEGEIVGHEHEGMRLVLQEQPSGHFERTIHLRAKVDAEKAEAEVRDGVLTLRVPKAEEAKTRKITVKAK